MGKFGNRRLPKFMEKEKDLENGSNPRAKTHQIHEEPISEMGGHGSEIVEEFIEAILARPDLWIDMGFSHNASAQDIIEYIEDTDKHEFFEMRQEFETLKNMHKHMKSGGKINECWTPITEDYVPGLSDASKLAIKRICEEVLIHEAHLHDMTEDHTQTYATYMNECYQHMTECMIRAAQNIKI